MPSALHILQAIANGLEDIAWANEQLHMLKTKCEEVAKQIVLTGEPSRYDTAVTRQFAACMDETVAGGSKEAIRGVLREIIDRVTLDPGRLQIRVEYAFPGPLTKTDPGDSGVCRGAFGSGGRILGIGERVFSFATLTPCVDKSFPRPPGVPLAA